MATVNLLTDAEVDAIPAAKAVFDDIRATRKSDFINISRVGSPMIRRCSSAPGKA